MGVYSQEIRLLVKSEKSVASAAKQILAVSVRTKIAGFRVVNNPEIESCDSDFCYFACRRQADSIFVLVPPFRSHLLRCTVGEKPKVVHITPTPRVNQVTFENKEITAFQLQRHYLCSQFLLDSKVGVLGYQHDAEWLLPV